MAKNVLITGGETLLGKKLIEKYVSEGARVFSPVPKKDESEAAEATRSDRIVELNWSKSSIFSTKTVVREALRLGRTIDEAVILHTPSSYNETIEEISITEIDETIDGQINGLIYIAKELVDLFTKKEKGHLSFAISNWEKKPTALQLSTSGFFRYFAKGIISKERPGVFQTAYYSVLSDSSSFADFIYNYNSDKLDKANGEWLKHSEKKPLFSSLPLLKKEHFA